MRFAALLLVALSLLLVVALYAEVSIDASPTQTTTSGTLLSFSTTTNFDYRATLRPNTLFGNGTLGPGGGALYESLVLRLDLTYSYWLNLSAPANVTWGAGFSVTIAVPGQWTYTLNYSKQVLPPEVHTISAPFHDDTEVALPPLLSLLSTFQNETRSNPSSYDLNFTAYEVAAIQYDNLPAHSVTYPVLTFTLASGELVPGPLFASSNGSIPTTLPVTDSSRSTSLDLAIAACVILAAGVGIAAAFTLRPRNKKVDVSAEVRSMTAAYQDAIATTWTAPRKENVVVIRDWEDLIHVADMLGKPILRYVLRKYDPPRHFFYVLDGQVQYIYLVPREGRRAEEEIADLP